MRAPHQVFLNLSVTELAELGLYEHLSAAASATGIDAQRLVLEATESALLQETHAVARVVGPLLELGCQLAIDDFGTGHSSLARLVQAPASVLKIDRSFAQAVARSDTAAAVIRSVLLLGQALHMTVVAEVVEDGDTITALRRLGCTRAQGYHLARPGPADLVSRRLAAPAT